MFRNKVLVRATAAAASSSSSSPPPPFLLRQVSLPAAAPIPAVDLDILCCRLSRRRRLACLPQPPADVLLVYQRCQCPEAAEAASAIVAAFPGASVGEEEELACSGELVSKAVGCGLRFLMLEHGWRCLGESIYIEPASAENEETSDLRVVHVEVQLGRNDDFEFVVSPDALRFTNYKISEAASNHMTEILQPRKEEVLDNCNFLTLCTTLPTLQEGHVIGFSKLLPSNQCLDKFMELCSIKHGLDTSYSYHGPFTLICRAPMETQWLPSSFVLQGSGLQPALKSVRASKAMSSLQTFIELLKAWSFFGQDKLVTKEQLLLNCTATLPTWDMAANNMTLQTPRTDSSMDQPFILVHTYFYFLQDFRTPKPAVLWSSTAKSWDTKSHKISHSLDENGYLGGTSPIKYGCQSKPLVPTSSYKSQVTLMKPSFSRNKSAEKSKMRYSSASHPNTVSEDSERKNGFQGSGGNAKDKDYTSGIPEVAKAIPDIEKDLLNTKVIQTKLMSVVAKDKVTTEAKTKAEQDLAKNELVAPKLEKVPEVVKNEFAGKVRDNQNDELNKKVTKTRVKPVDKGLLKSTTRTKAKTEVTNDELIAKVIEHHRRGELRLLTVADLKCFLGVKKAKLGGTKEVLIQRAGELLV
ncbi:hypothetical protein ACP4OV_019154 [Aristida adscensionis]